MMTLNGEKIFNIIFKNYKKVNYCILDEMTSL